MEANLSQEPESMIRTLFSFDMRSALRKVTSGVISVAENHMPLQHLLHHLEYEVLLRLYTHILSNLLLLDSIEF